MSLFKLLILMPGEDHMPVVSLKNMFSFFFLLLPAIHPARASKHIRTLIYNSYAYVVESPKSLRTNLPMENRPYGGPRHSECNWSQRSPLAPSPAWRRGCLATIFWNLRCSCGLWMPNWNKISFIWDSNRFKDSNAIHISNQLFLLKNALCLVLSITVSFIDTWTIEWELISRN